MAAVTMPQPTYRKTKPDSSSISKPSDRYLSQLKPFSNLPSCGRRNGWLLSISFSREQNSVLCVLLGGTMQISVQRGLGLLCTFSLCKAGIIASKLESHHSSWQSSSKLPLLLDGFQNLCTSYTQMGWHLLQMRSLVLSQGGGTGNLPAAAQNPESIVLMEVSVLPNPMQNRSWYGNFINGFTDLKL